MMKPFLLALVWFSLSVVTNGQVKLNIPLKRELDSLQLLDQKYRSILSANMMGKGDSLAAIYGIKKENLNDYFWQLQGELDSLTIARVEKIINDHGYHGLSLVGKPTNEVVFCIVQHSKDIDKYLPIIKAAAEKKELGFHLYAMMLDRSLMFQDKEQVYGT